MNLFSPITLLLIPLVGSLLISFVNENNYSNIRNMKYSTIIQKDKIGYNLKNFQSSKYNKNRIKQERGESNTYL